jgi:mRNA-degrading endonuclease RelE of RelBE toxin-antitoxin system
MSKNPPHKWHFFVDTEALSALRKMQRGHRMAVLRHLRLLVNADAPYELPFVQALQGKEYEHVRKFRVGDYRILFTLDTRPITHNKFTYKGTIIILSIGQRKDIYRP